MSDDRDTEALETARDLTAALTEVSARLDAVKAASEARDTDLRTYGRHNRWYILFDIVLTVALAVSTFIAVNASQHARDAQASAAAARAAVSVTQQDSRNLCLSSNVARAQSIELWTFILDLPGSRTPTARQEEQIKAFRAYLDRVYAPRDCSHPGPGNP